MLKPCTSNEKQNKTNKTWLLTISWEIPPSLCSVQPKPAASPVTTLACPAPYVRAPLGENHHSGCRHSTKICRVESPFSQCMAASASQLRSQSLESRIPDPTHQAVSLMSSFSACLYLHHFYPGPNHRHLSLEESNRLHTGLPGLAWAPRSASDDPLNHKSNHVIPLLQTIC